MKKQSEYIIRIEEICNEFDDRVLVVGLPIARLELAKALAQAEGEPDTCPICNNRLVIWCQRCKAVIKNT